MSASPPPNWPIPADANSITVNGYPYAYREAGSGVPIVLIHGSIGDYRVWTTQLAAFLKRNRVVTPSLRHYYPEPWTGAARPGEEGNFSIEQHASDVAAFIKALNLGKVHLLGWSRGGAVVNAVAKRAPEVIRTLILEDSTIDIAGMENPAMREAQAEFTRRFDALKACIRKGDLEGGARTFYDTTGGLGTGGGLPGIPIKIARPDISITFCDSIMKKITAVEEMSVALHLENFSAITQRAEALALNKQHRHIYDVVVTRAVAPLEDLLRWSHGLLKKGGVLLSLKGGNLTQEIAQAKNFKLAKTIDVSPLSLKNYDEFLKEEKKFVRVSMV